MTTNDSSLEGAREPSLNVWWILAFYVFMFIFILSFIYVISNSGARDNPHLTNFCNNGSSCGEGFNKTLYEAELNSNKSFLEKLKKW